MVLLKQTWVISFTFAALVNPLLFCLFVFLAQAKWTDSAQKQDTKHHHELWPFSNEGDSSIKTKINTHYLFLEYIQFYNLSAFEMIKWKIHLDKFLLGPNTSQSHHKSPKLKLNHKVNIYKTENKHWFHYWKKRREDLFFFVQSFPTRDASIWCLIWWPAFNNVFYCQPKSRVCGAAVGTMLASKCKTKKKQNAISNISN